MFVYTKEKMTLLDLDRKPSLWERVVEWVKSR